MKTPLSLKSFSFRLSLSLKGIASVVQRRGYLTLAFLLSFLFAQLIFWLLNLGLLGYILATPNLSLLEKVSFLAETTLTFVKAADTLQGFLLLAVSIVQGLAITILVYNFKRSSTVDRKSISGSSLASLGAVVGLGCAACGTSLILPVVAIFFSGTAYVLVDTIGLYASFAALAIGLYALFRIGYVAYGSSGGSNE